MSEITPKRNRIKKLEKNKKNWETLLSQDKELLKRFLYDKN